MSYKVEKDWKLNGLRCVVMMTDLGHRCGYVGISKENKLYKVGYSDKPKFLQKELKKLKKSDIGKRGILSVFCWNGEEVSPEILFDVHGGITFSGGGYHSKYPVRSNLWWFGYDCAHAGDGKDLSNVNDAVRKVARMFPNTDPIRSLEYCIVECESLVKQIKLLT